jgi:hypothetical protein
MPVYGAAEASKAAAAQQHAYLPGLLGIQVTSNPMLCSHHRDSTPRHPRALLVDTLWPLTHDTEAASCDLAPHAAPKAKVRRHLSWPPHDAAAVIVLDNCTSVVRQTAQIKHTPDTAALTRQ